jgi:hypothetical protein
VVDLVVEAVELLWEVLELRVKVLLGDSQTLVKTRITLALAAVVQAK